MGSIQYACKTIANLVSRAGISDLTGLQVRSLSRGGGEGVLPNCCRLIILCALAKLYIVYSIAIYCCITTVIFR